METILFSIFSSLKLNLLIFLKLLDQTNYVFIFPPQNRIWLGLKHFLSPINSVHSELHTLTAVVCGNRWTLNIHYTRQLLWQVFDYLYELFIYAPTNNVDPVSCHGSCIAMVTIIHSAVQNDEARKVIRSEATCTMGQPYRLIRARWAE